MHGYHPNEKHSYAALLTNQEHVPEDITGITDLFRLMTRDAQLANDANGIEGPALPSRLRKEESPIFVSEKK